MKKIYLAGVCPGPHVVDFLVAHGKRLVGHLRADRGEDATRHRREYRRESERELLGPGGVQTRRMGEVLQNLGDMTMCAAHAIGHGGTERLGGEQVRALEVLARAEYPTTRSATRSRRSTSPSAMAGCMASVVAVTLQPGPAMRLAPGSRSR